MKPKRGAKAQVEPSLQVFLMSATGFHVTSCRVNQIRCPWNQRQQMNSSTSRTNAQKLTQEEIKRQIAELQACLQPELEEHATNPPPKSPKRKALEATVLAPATPSPSEV